MKERIGMFLASDLKRYLVIPYIPKTMRSLAKTVVARTVQKLKMPI